jgi:hypothetical protein
LGASWQQVGAGAGQHDGCGQQLRDRRPRA